MVVDVIGRKSMCFLIEEEVVEDSSPSVKECFSLVEDLKNLIATRFPMETGRGDVRLHSFSN